MDNSTVPPENRLPFQWSAPDPLLPLQPALLNRIEDLFWRAEEGSTGLFRPAIRMRLDGFIDEQFLVPALQNLQRRHPKLRAMIFEGSDGLLRYDFGNAVPPIPFRIVDSADQDPPWRDEMRQLMRGTFPVAGPLLAITVIRNRSRRLSELLLAAHHSIADGLSAIMLVDDLLAEYSSAETERPIPIRPVMPLALPGRADSASGWLAKLRLFRRFLRVQRQERRPRQVALPLAPDIPPQSQWAHWTYPAEDTLALVRRCRREHVAAGAALVAAVLRGLVDCLPVAEHVFKCQTPFDLRAALAVTPRDLGCFVSIKNEFYQIHGQPQIWDLARRVQRDYETFVHNGGPAFNYNLSPLFIAFTKLTAPMRRLAASSATSRSGSEERPTLFATNYGVVGVREAYGSLRPRECTLGFRSDPSGPLLVLETLILGQRLNLGLAADGLERSFWDRLQVAVRHHLEAAIADTRRAAADASRDGGQTAANAADYRSAIG